MSDRELSLYGAGDTIADRLAREVRDLRAQRSASRERVMEAVRAACATAPGWKNFRLAPSDVHAIAICVADAVAAPQPALDAARVRSVVRRIAVEIITRWLDVAHAAEQADVIAARAAEQLVGQAVVDLNDQERTRLRSLLATEPAVSEERCGEIESSLVEAGNATGERENFDWLCILIAQVPEALAAARQLHALLAGLREIVSPSVVPTSRPASDGPRKADSAPPAEDPDAPDRVVIDPDDPEQLAEGLVAGALDGDDIAPESLLKLARSHLEVLAMLRAAQNDQQIAVLEAEAIDNRAASAHGGR